MKIALLGYGKMGRIIEEIAIERGHTIVLKIDAENRASLTAEQLKQADVAIEFTVPESAFENICLSIDAGVPIVVGTTGWYDRFEEVKVNCWKKNGCLFYASNFSLGVNMFFALNKALARWMNKYPDYQVAVEEVHHTQKLDAPSGTAITIANDIVKNIGRKKEWKSHHVNEKDQNVPEAELPVYHDRKEGVPGYHKVTYTSAIDQIEISHNAFNRKGFGLGAVLAAEFIQHKQGIFTNEDLFKFEI